MQSNAHDYWAVWKQFVLHGVMKEDVLPPALLQSWRRCASTGLDVYGTVEVHDYPETPLFTIPASPALLSLVRPTIEDLYQFVEGSECVVVFADTHARIIDLVGDPATQTTLKHLGVHIGMPWHEELQGSNALALALRESFPIQLDGAMHYRAALHHIYTSAAPIHDLLGQTVGVIGVIGLHEHCHPHTLGMVTAAAQALTNQLQMQVWLSNANDLLSELRTILQSLPEGILLLRRNGMISQMNTPAGTMLGLIPAKVTGRRIHDILPLPNVLTQAITTHQSLSDEELVFDTVHGRVTCLCTLRGLAIPPSTLQAEQTSELKTEAMVTATGLHITESSSADGFIMILRSIERVQKLVHRMTGTHARLTFDNVIGESPVLKEALRLARLASRSNSTVLLYGETGTGKEIFAQSIHNSSARADKPFVAINCAAIPRELIHTELFGYEGGAFTGADRQGRPGKFEQAHGGTLFLDEIGDMPLDLQTSLLRAIETRTIVRIGGHRTISADVRIITATHKNLREEARLGNFRYDLYYRLNVLSITIPPLRERAADIPLLVQHFLLRQSRIQGRPLMITPDAMQTLQQAPWPGNVRELENTLERITYLMLNDTITMHDLPVEMQPALEAPPQQEELVSLRSDMLDSANILKEQSTTAEIQAILHAYRSSDGHIARAATLLGISRSTLWRKMVKYGITEIKSL